MDSHNPIDVQNISKRYGDFVAVDGISFTVTRGTIFGLLGPNGAGKTTTIRMIMNIIAPDSGAISVFGRPSTEAAARMIGYLPEERGLYRKMKVIDHLVFLGEIRGLTVRTSKQRSEEWLERLKLTDWRTKKVEELSKGMQQKIQFIGCVIHEPEALILDEPFSGLDPVAAASIKDLFLEFRAKGKTLILSTHLMDQAERLCDEIALINRAKVVLSGQLGEIRQRFSGNRIILRGSGETEQIRTLAGVKDVRASDGAVDVELEPDMEKGSFLRSLTRIYDLESAVPHKAGLEEIFVKVVGEQATQPDMRFQRSES